ncbi:MAG: YopX family protein [Candidatus Saccharibacteria bacterium]|nr:YopX family protein [Candidatus Saccharibacteria bacterium]
MRELKFRVWSNEQNTYDYTFPYNQNGTFYVSANGCLCSDFGNTVAPELRPDEFVIEQYTGLKDKNGKEIYEGDVIKTHKTMDKYFTVGYYMTRYGYAPYFTPLMDYISGLVDGAEIEVIGNIHENPELLE